MAVRKIEYTLTQDGIQPAIKQFGGVQGDHRATELVFLLEERLYNSLLALAEGEGKTLVYRFDGYDGSGGRFCTAPTALKDQRLSFVLEEWLTRYGGTVKAVLVISLLDMEQTEMELYSFPALLQLKNLPAASDTDGQNHQSLSLLAEVTKNASKTAADAADTAVEAMDRTESARRALEDGTVFIFDGGNASLDGQAELELVIDTQISDLSENPVTNKAIKEYVNSVHTQLSESDEQIRSYTDGMINELSDADLEIRNYVDTVKDELSAADRELRSYTDTALGGFADRIVQFGQDGIWHYKLYDGGEAEIYGQAVVTDTETLINLPPNMLTSVRACFLSLHIEEGVSFVPDVQIGAYANNTGVTVRASRATTGGGFHISLLIKGAWK